MNVRGTIVAPMFSAPARKQASAPEWNWCVLNFTDAGSIIMSNFNLGARAATFIVLALQYMYVCTSIHTHASSF